MSHVKKLSYKEPFLPWGLTRFVNKSVEKPQCVLCTKVLTAESMKLCKLKNHFEGSHSQFVGKIIEFHKHKETVLKYLGMDSLNFFFSQLKLVLNLRIALLFDLRKTKNLIKSEKASSNLV